MNENFFAILGAHSAWPDIPFGLGIEDSRQHLYCIGKTGTGKTTLLKSLICQHIEAGHGVGVIDPHGDMAEELLDYIPPRRIDHTVYFNPADLAHPVGFNMLANVPMDERHLAASEMVSAFKSIWHDSWGPRLEYILYNSLAALLDCQGVTLLALPRLLTDRPYRRTVVKQIKDPLVQGFWINEFEHYDERFMREAIAPVQNKIGQFLQSAVIRNIVGQVRNKVDFRFMMDDQRIFLANLSKGQLGADKANLLGSLLVAQFQLAAMSRADIPEHERRDFWLFIDEFQNFTTDAFAGILAEARKYRLCLTLGHQYMDQLSDAVRSAVLGNVGSIIAFRVGSTDAGILANEFNGTFAKGQFMDLPNYQGFAKLLTNGSYGEPFRGQTFSLQAKQHGRAQTVIKRSREKYTLRRGVIEEKIRRWSEHN